jgi:thymidylate kinase
MPAIILEGNECTFKSTVAQLIKNEFPEYHFEVIKGSSFESATKGNKELFRFYLNILSKLKDKNVILDRFFVSNLVYATVYPKYQMLTIGQVSLIEKTLNEVGCLMYYLTDATSSLYERLKMRGDKYIKTKEELDKISKTYNTVIDDIKDIPIGRINIQSIDLIIDTISIDFRYNKMFKKA